MVDLTVGPQCSAGKASGNRPGKFSSIAYIVLGYRRVTRPIYRPPTARDARPPPTIRLATLRGPARFAEQTIRSLRDLGVDFDLDHHCRIDQPGDLDHASRRDG